MSGMGHLVLLFWLLGRTVQGGTVYMVTFPSQLDTTGDQYHIHIVGNPGTTVTIETPYNVPQGSSLNLGDTGHYEEPVSRTLYYLEPNLHDLQTKGVRIYSDDHFTVSIIYGEKENSASAGGYSSIPVPVLQEPSFVIITYDQSGSSFVYFAIASSEDNITVSIKVKTADRVRFRNSFYYNDDTLELTLQKLQVLQLESKRDLTGTVIRSNGPIAVFAGIVCAAIPLGETSCDNILEQLPSVDLWGYRYLAAPLPGRTGGTVLRIVGAYIDTSIQMISDGNIVNLQLEDVFEWEMASQAYEIIGAKPILVVQFSKSSSVDGNGGAAMTVLRAVEYYSPKFYVVAATGFQTYVNILIKTEEKSILLDDNSVANTAEMFLEGTVNLFSFNVSEGLHVIQSTNLSAVFDVVVYGYREGQGISYQALKSIPEETTGTTTTSVTTASPATATESLAASTLSSIASSMFASTSSSMSVTDSGTDPLSHTASTDASSVVDLYTESSLESPDTGNTITMETTTPSSSSLSSSAGPSLVFSDTIEITTTVATSPTTPSSVSSVNDVLVFSSVVLDTAATADSPSVSRSTSPVDTDSGRESPTSVGSTDISSTIAVSTGESLDFSGTVGITTAPSSSTPSSTSADGTPSAADATQSPDFTASLSPTSDLMDASYTPVNTPSVWFSGQSTTSYYLDQLVTSGGATYGMLVTSSNVGSITPSSVSSETGSSTTHTSQVIPTSGEMKTTKRSENRRCHCGRVLMTLNVTSMEFQQMLLEKKKNLTLSHQRLSSYIRSKTSAHDHRPTAQNVGYVGIAMLATIAALLFCGDVVTLLKRLF